MRMSLQARSEAIIERGTRAVEGRPANSVVLREECELHDFSGLRVLMKKKILDEVTQQIVSLLTVTGGE